MYKAKITKEKDGTYFVSFPDCDGCTTYGATRGEAIRMAEDALDGWLEAHLAMGRIPPRPKAKTGVSIPVRFQLATVLGLRWAREDQRLNQADVARAAGVSQQAIAKVENPSANPSLATVAKVARALGLRPEVEFRKIG